jgi:hypothetical protein
MLARPSTKDGEIDEIAKLKYLSGGKWKEQVGHI